MALDTVTDYVNEARTLLQDSVAPYRYDDASLVSSLNLGVLEARKLRPDLFLGVFDALPDDFVEADIAAETAFSMDQQYRTAFLYFIVGFAQLRDDEETQDARAGAFLTRFRTVLGAP